MKKLNWIDFDECIYYISMRCKNKKFEGVYGFPRGGLCLAVALSHSLGLPLLDKPKNNSLIVDDIYDTGYTLEKIKHLKGAETHVWRPLYLDIVNDFSAAFSICSSAFPKSDAGY